MCWCVCLSVDVQIKILNKQEVWEEKEGKRETKKGKERKKKRPINSLTHKKCKHFIFLFKVSVYLSAQSGYLIQ